MGRLILTPLYHFHSLFRHLAISRAITADSLPLFLFLAALFRVGFFTRSLPNGS